jgi:YggT family protein
VKAAEVPCALVTVYIVILFLRAIFSWFPPPGGGAATLYRILLDLTEPVLAPLRRVIPPAGMFDLSFLVLIVFMYIVRAAVCH